MGRGRYNCIREECLGLCFTSQCVLYQLLQNDNPKAMEKKTLPLCKLI